MLLHRIFVHVNTLRPCCSRNEGTTPPDCRKICEKDSYASQAAATGKLPQVVEKIVEGKMSKFYEEVCLDEQPFIKDQTIKISDLISAKGDKLGEKIAVRRFARLKVGDSFSSAVSDRDHGPEGGDQAGMAVKKPQSPNLDSGFAAANLDEESE